MSLQDPSVPTYEYFLYTSQSLYICLLAFHLFLPPGAHPPYNAELLLSSLSSLYA